MANTFRHIVYMCIDELKLISGDSDYTPEHLMYILSKLRAYLIEKKSKDFREILSDANRQEICIDLEKTQMLGGTFCEDTILKSTVQIPARISTITDSFSVYTSDIFNSSHISLVEPERMPFVGNKWTRNMLYCTIANDGYLYMKSTNPGFLNLKKVKVSGLFSDIEEAAKLECCSCNDGSCDIMDARFPIEDSLVTLLIQSAVQELSGQRYMPKDKQNNSQDDMAGQASATPRNINRQYVQQQ